MSRLTDEQLEQIYDAVYENPMSKCGRHESALRAIAEAAVAAERAATPDLSACFMTAESGGGENKIVLRFQTLAKMQDAHSAMVHWLAAAPVPERDRNAYEELRAIIDGGSESMTHSDAVEWCQRHADADWKPVSATPAAPAPEHLPDATKMVVPEGYALVPVDLTPAMWRAGRSKVAADIKDWWKALLAAAQEATK